MKKILNKLRRKKNNSSTNDGHSSFRITNETVAEHRERILATGRKFKYPLQYSKHRIVFITTGLVLALVLGFSGIASWRLYIAQDTSDFMYRMTQILPLPVATGNNRNVPYSDYLLSLKSGLYYLSNKEGFNFSSDDGKRQLEYQKRLALNKAIENTYVQQLAKVHNLSITDKELDDFIKKQIKNSQLGITEDMYKQVIKDYYDWTFDDYKYSVRQQLLRQKVLAKTDQAGRDKITKSLTTIKQGQDFAAVAKNDSEDPASKPNGGDIGFIRKDTDDPNHLIQTADQLAPNQVSEVIEGMDGFYIVKLIEKRDNELHLAKLFVPYRTFAAELEQLRKEGKIKEYISVPLTVNPTTR